MGITQFSKQWLNGGRLTTLILLAGQISAALGAVVVNILAAKVLDPSDRGDLAFGLQIAYFLTVFATMGLERPYIASRDGVFNNEYRNFTKLVIPGVLIIVPIALLAIHLSPLGSTWIGYGVAAIVIYTVLNVVSRGVRVGYVVSRDWKGFTFNAIGSQVLIVAGAIILLLLNISQPEAWMIVYTVSTLPAIILFVLAVRKKNEQTLSKEESANIRRKGWLLLPSDFSNTAMMRSDRLLLPILGTSAELGLYVTVATVLEMASWPVKQWVDTSLREWARVGKSLFSSIPRIMLKACIGLCALSIILGLATFIMIRFFLPDSYLPAVDAIIPLAIGSVIFGMTRIQQGVLVACGAAASVSLVEIVGTIVSVTSYLLLIPTFGMFGAAYGSIIGYFICFLFGAIVLIKVTRSVDS